MTATRHQQLNSLVGQIQTDAESVRRTAAAGNAFTADQLKIIANAAQAILNKVSTYEKLNASDGDLRE